MSPVLLHRSIGIACLVLTSMSGLRAPTAAAESLRPETPVLIAAKVAPKAAAKPKPTTTSTTSPTTASGSDESTAILTRVAEGYRGFETYNFQGVVKVAVSVNDQVQNLDLPFTVAASKPGKFRAEISNPMLQMINVSDGQQTWNYIPQLGQYTKKMVAPLETEKPAPPNPVVAATPLSRYQSLDKSQQPPRLLREETVEVTGVPHECHVIETHYVRPEDTELDVSPTTLWIDKTRQIVLRESTVVKLTAGPTGGPMEMRQVTTFHIATVNETVPDSVFVFRPPADAKEVAEIAMPGMQPAQSELVGKPALPFKLKNLSGKLTTLAAWKGKVVLLDFWASWCGPCRIEMPVIAKLDKELKAKGLVVVPVNVGETATVASNYLKKNNYTFGSLLDTDSDISNQYGATGIPTVVIIDRKGVVSSHFVGVRSEEVLREALKKAGL